MATIVKRPNGKWQASIRHVDASRSKTFTQRADAVKWARQTEIAYERGELCGQQEQKLEDRTLATALEMYRDEVAVLHGSGPNETASINAMLRDHSWICCKNLDELTATDVSKWRDLRLECVKPSTVVRELTLLRSAIDYALGPERSDTVNVVKLVKRPRVDDRRDRTVRPEEWHALLDACDAGQQPLLKPFIVMARETGMRRGELLSVQWRNVNWSQCTIFLTATKNGRSRNVPLSPPAVETVSDLPRTHAHIFPMSANAVRLGWQRIRKRAGVHDLRLHDLRAQCATDWLLRGWSVAEVQLLTGHRDPTVLLDRYARLKASDIVQKMRAFQPDKSVQ
ncbi:MAG: site-specific integrase [Tateyamaria sp.]|uniref:tyrosine-type recombinase/integrase n=1 Tax=Tateyamaria sp. TaxID=1929288 RepID=UPI0032A13DC8